MNKIKAPKEYTKFRKSQGLEIITISFLRPYSKFGINNWIFLYKNDKMKRLLYLYEKNIKKTPAYVLVSILFITFLIIFLFSQYLQILCGIELQQFKI